MDYVRARAADGNPFLLSLHYTAPHWPSESRASGGAKPEIDADIRHKDWGSIHVYRQMIREMDLTEGGTRRPVAAPRAARSGLAVQPPALLAHEVPRPEGDARWKMENLSIDDNEYLFDLSQDERELANQARRQPERLATMRTRYENWNATMAPIPDDAKSIPVYTEADMPAR